MKGLDIAADLIALFGGEASPAVTQLLKDAAAFYQQTNRAEAILWSAQAGSIACVLCPVQILFLQISP
jgi:hypothetical protein